MNRVIQSLCLKYKRFRRHRHVNHGFLPYGWLVKLQVFFLSRSWLQMTFYSRWIRLLKVFARNPSGSEIKRIVLASLMSNTGNRWRVSALKQPEALKKYIDFQGIQVLEKASMQDQGVIIVVTHSVGRGLHRQIITAYSAREVFPLGGMSFRENKAYVMASFAQQIIDAQKILQHGGIVLIAGDGVSGKAYLNLPWYGHAFPFHTGFAELAVRAGVKTLALFEYLDIDGRITVELVEVPPPPPGSREVQVEHLVRTYAQLMAEREPAVLSSMRWHKLFQISSMPPLMTSSPIPND
jgi:lauroyl/myristoyl acyltransferase